MKNVVELRTQLAIAFEGLSNGELSSKDASEMANLAGKMINSAKVQLDYHALRKDTPSIKFLHVEEDVKN
jgi:hypothetical protein|tara:strand:- start:309 stop:518 length:210 start_codon:yes stop_codon:yes gene_type:complete